MTYTIRNPGLHGHGIRKASAVYMSSCLHVLSPVAMSRGLFTRLVSAPVGKEGQSPLRS